MNDIIIITYLTLTGVVTIFVFMAGYWNNWPPVRYMAWILFWPILLLVLGTKGLFKEIRK